MGAVHAPDANLSDANFRLDATLLPPVFNVVDTGGEELDVVPDEAESIRHAGLSPVERVGEEGRLHRG